MSKAIYGRVKQYDFNMLNEVKKDLEESTPFLRGLDKIESTNKNDYFDLRFALSNRDPIKTNEILDKYKIEAPVELLNRIWQE